MKKIFLLGLAFAAVLFLNACSDDSVTNVLNNGMSAKVAGKAWSSDILHTTATLKSGVLVLTGMEGLDSNTIVLTIPNFTGTAGTYELGSTNSNAATYLTSTSGNIYSTFGLNSSGSIVITSYTSSNIKGTFSFVASNSLNETISVTNGQFNISLTL